jgi:hypothetical protein
MVESFLWAKVEVASSNPDGSNNNILYSFFSAV